MAASPSGSSPAAKACAFLRRSPPTTQEMSWNKPSGAGAKDASP